MSKNDLKLKLAGACFETKDDYNFNAVNANEAMLLLLYTTSSGGAVQRSREGPRPTMALW